MTGQGLTVDSIRKQLPIVTAQPPAVNSLALVPSIARELARVDENNRSVLSQLETLSAAFQADHERLDRLSAWATLLWWKCLFTPPPK
jgi:hypothetical protein